MLIDYFNGCARARSLGIEAQIKIMGEPYLGLPSKRYKTVSWKKKKFEDIKDLLVFFRLYFVIVKDSSCISTMYYLLL
jgi:hypothetical protein